MSSSGQPRFRLISVDDLDTEDEGRGTDGLLGRKIAGRYVLQAHIGGGGMADVYRASDEELGIDVAIKLLKPERTSDDMPARMVQEARAAAQVRHGNLVRVFGTGKLDDTAYIAMELLDGPNLETYLRERPGQRLPWPEALDLLLPALEALHAVHEQGYVHRDIKPGNILVARESGCPPRAVIIDLGLAKPDRALRSVDDAPKTEAGRIMCTPGYASPEQVCQRPVDRRSDVYSMAITLYRVLAGRLPFQNAHGRPAYVVFAHHVHQDPTVLADAAAGIDIPPSIAQVIESALAKDPADRPRTMLAFAEALQTAAAAASSPPTRSPFHYWPHGLIVVQILVLFFAWRLSPARGQEHRATSRAEPVRQSSPSKPENDPPTPADTPAAALELAEPTTTPEAPVAAQPVAPPHDPTSAVRRTLARRAPAVQTCAEDTVDKERLPVIVNMDTTGRVTAHIQNAVDTPLSRCIDQALGHRTPTPPSRPLSFVHTFKLRVNPRRP